MWGEEETVANEGEVCLGRGCPVDCVCGVASCQAVGWIWKVGDQMQSYLFSFEQI